MTDMTSQAYDEAHPRRSRQDGAIYYTVFSILFVFSLIVFACLRVFGHKVAGGVVKGAKRAASGPAGFAIKF